MLTKSLATEWAKEGITVNAIGPGYFAMGMAEGVVADPEFVKTLLNLCVRWGVQESPEIWIQQSFTSHPMHQSILQAR